LDDIRGVNSLIEGLSIDPTFTPSLFSVKISLNTFFTSAFFVNEGQQKNPKKSYLRLEKCCKRTDSFETAGLF